MSKVLAALFCVVPATVGLILRLHEVIGPQTLSAISVSGFFAVRTFREMVIRGY